MARRAPFLFLFFAAGCVRAQTPAPAVQAEQPLIEAQALVDQGKPGDAESAVRRYLETHKTSADAHYLLGYILFREQNPKASIAEYTEGARYRAPAALDLEVIGCDYFLMEDYVRADEWLTKSVAKNPGDPLALYYLGRAKYNEKHFEEAAGLFEKCLALDPKNSKAQDNLGLSYEALGKTAEALKAYQAAVTLDGGAARNPEPYLHLGTLLAENGRAGEAISPLAQATGIAPENWEAHRELGKAYLLLNRLGDARREMEKAAALAPQNAPVHFLLAEIFKKQGQSEKARAEAERYAELTGAHSAPDTPLTGARSLVDLGKLDEAERVTRAYLETHKNSAEGHYLLGYLLFKKQDAKGSLAEYTEAAKYRTPGAGDLEVVAGDYVLLRDYADADKWFTKSLEWNPKNALGWYYLGRTKYNENRFEEAIGAFEQCLKLEPRNVKAEDNLGLSYEGLNRRDEAAAAYRKAIQWQADSPVKDSGPFLDLGGLLMDNGRLDEALPYLKEAARISPEDYRTHRQLGKAYAHLNRLAEAQTELERAAGLAPQNAPVHSMLAQIYRREGFEEKAKAEIARYNKLAASSSGPENSQ